MSNNRAFTFTAYNHYELPCEMFFQLRSVAAADVRLESPPEQLWNKKMQQKLRSHPHLKQLSSESKHPIIAPLGIELAVSPVRIEVGVSQQMRLMPELYDKLELGPLSAEEAGLRLKQGKLLKLSPAGSQGRDSGLFRLLSTLRPAGKGAANIGVLRSERFQMKSGEMRPCSIRVECPPDRATVVHVEQWRVGTNGDLHRPLGHLQLLFPAEGQLAKLEPLQRKNA